MSETKPSEIKPKKMVRRSVAVSLGIICILLIAGIAYFSITDITAQNSYNNLQNQNNQLQAWLRGNETSLNQTETWLEGNITYYESQINLLNSQISSLNSQIASLQNQTVNLTRDPNLQAGLLLHLPAPASAFYTFHEFGSLDTILLSLSLDQSKPGDQQSKSVPGGTTITVTGEFQIFNPTQNAGDVRQAFFIYSWTPSWPAPNSNYYQPLYDDVPPTYPGITQAFNFNLTVPYKQGLYYLFFCFGERFNMQDAVNQYPQSPLAPHAVIIVGNTQPQP